MNENKTNENAISVYGQDGLEDFPVLKAFQQYVDAEQNKARKRMVLLCIFFGALMTGVIIVFMSMLQNVSMRNQALNDKLLEYVMKDRDRQQVVVSRPESVQPVQPARPTESSAANDAALKIVTDTLLTLQKQIADQQTKSAELATQLAENAKAVQKQEGVANETAALQRKLDAENAKIAKAQAQLKTEQDKIAAEKERLHQQEVELHRRRLYPEYYDKQDAKPLPSAEPVQAPVAAPKPAKTVVTPPAPVIEPKIDATDEMDFDDGELGEPDIDGILELMPEKNSSAAKPAAEKPATKTQTSKSQTSKSESLNVKVGDSESDWLIPNT